jgi:hypothetical protein
MEGTVILGFIFGALTPLLPIANSAIEQRDLQPAVRFPERFRYLARTKLPRTASESARISKGLARKA